MFMNRLLISVSWSGSLPFAFNREIHFHLSCPKWHFIFTVIANAVTNNVQKLPIKVLPYNIDFLDSWQRLWADVSCQRFHLDLMAQVNITLWQGMWAHVLFQQSRITDNTVNVLKISDTLLHTFASIFSADAFFFIQITWCNGKKCRPWSDFSFRSSLICVCPVCICHFKLAYKIIGQIHVVA